MSHGSALYITWLNFHASPCMSAKTLVPVIRSCQELTSTLSCDKYPALSTHCHAGSPMAVQHPSLLPPAKQHDHRCGVRKAAGPTPCVRCASRMTCHDPCRPRWPILCAFRTTPTLARQFQMLSSHNRPQHPTDALNASPVSYTNRRL